MFKNLIKFITIFYLCLGNAFAESFIDYNVTGNKRISTQTIINFSKLDVGVDLSKKDLNDALKNIYESNFFEEVSLDISNNILNIKVKELPIIQDVEFLGIKAKKYVELLKKQISLKPKSSFNQFTLQADLNLISNILRKSGFYFSKVVVQQTRNSNNTINIIYDVTMGAKAKIKDINFIGDKKFKSSKLAAVIISEESKFWKFLSKNKYLNRERTQLDKRLLKNFYLDKGYYEVNIEDVYTQILDEQSFSLTYKIDSGQKFFFNTLKIKIPDDYKAKDFDELKKIFKSLEKSLYSYEGISSILDEIDRIALSENYEFIDVTVDETINGGDKIDFTFNIMESEKFYVERINILGNNITNEEFIRQQLVVDEGDAFNNLLHNKTVNSLKATNIFKSVKTETKEGNSKGLKIIDIVVEEKPTGEISAGAGYGSSGSTFSIGIKENNFNGQGIKLDANISVTEDSLRGKFAYTNPNFLYSDRSVTTSLESTATDKEKNYGYKTTLNKISLGTAFEQYDNIYFAPTISIASESLTTTANASENYKKQEGTYFDTLLNYSLTYDKRNSPYRPTKGLISTFVQELPLVSDGYAILNGYQIKGYNEILNDSVLSIGLYTRSITTLKSNSDVRVSKRLFLPESKLRGFKVGRVGPTDGADYVGGNYMASFNTALSLPFLFPTFDKVDFALFFDAANVWHVDYSEKTNQANTVRSSTGMAIDVITPMGPLSFSLSKAITSAPDDQTESFRFNLGTTF